jgi:hypothetical protein
MGYRDTIWERSGYVELIVFSREDACFYIGNNDGDYSELSALRQDGTIAVTAQSGRGR